VSDGTDLPAIRNTTVYELETPKYDSRDLLAIRNTTVNQNTAISYRKLKGKFPRRAKTIPDPSFPVRFEMTELGRFFEEVAQQEE